jgi:hypothetical protein
MTSLAKYLVFVVTGLSLMFLAWSAGLYSQQLPWEIHIKETLAPRIRELVEARDRADARWYDATAKVNRLELEIPKRRAWYAKQLQTANESLEANPPPVREIEIRDGLVAMRDDAPAFQIDGAPALSYAGYRAAIEKQLAAIRDTKMTINKVVADTTVLTTLINGSKPAAEAITKEEKGLRGQLTDAQTVQRNALLEQQYLQSPLTNDTVELELLRRRQVALEARLKELMQAVLR